MPSRLIIVVAILLLAFVSTFGQRANLGRTYSRSLESQLRCKAKPQAAKFLLDLRRDGFINQPYVVEDSISYFKLLKPLRVLGFSPIGVFGYQACYLKFFERGPGTAPPEMIGIVVRANQDAVKLRLRNLGIDNLEVEPHEWDINRRTKLTRASQVSIGCWEN